MSANRMRSIAQVLLIAACQQNEHELMESCNRACFVRDLLVGEDGEKDGTVLASLLNMAKRPTEKCTLKPLKSNDRQTLIYYCGGCRKSFTLSTNEKNEVLLKPYQPSDARHPLEANPQILT